MATGSSIAQITSRSPRDRCASAVRNSPMRWLRILDFWCASWYATGVVRLPSPDSGWQGILEYLHAPCLSDESERKWGLLSAAAGAISKHDGQ
jgi:hypothetical protein